MDLLNALEDLGASKLTYEDATQVIEREVSSGPSSESEGEKSGPEWSSEGVARHQVILAKLNQIKLKISTVTQRIEPSEQVAVVSRLPQLDIDLSEIKSSVLFPSAGSTQVVTNDTQVVESSIEEKTRLAAERIKETRLQKEKLQGEISMTTLTDEEDDFYSRPQSSSNPTKQTDKELREVEQFLSSKKRQNFFDATARVKAIKKFTTSGFINDFQLEFTKASESEYEPEQATTPLTSPHKDSSPIKLSNPIAAYSKNLKKQFTEINLESSDSENESSSVPELAKDLKLAIKKKFSKVSPVKKKKNGKNFLNKLFASNINQLQELRRLNPENELLEEMEKDDEVMGSLLEREIERVRNIRKKEKMRERAQKALLAKGNSTQSKPNESDEEVPDSDNFDESGQDENLDEENQSEENNDEDNEDSSSEVESRRRHAKVVDSEGESDDMQSSPSNDVPSKSQESSDEASESEDSYMFGYSEKKGKKLTNNIRIDETAISTIGTQLFQNLEPHKPTESDASFDATKETSFINELPSFHDLPPSQLKRTQADLIEETQADITTQKDDLTQIVQASSQTQVLNEPSPVTNQILPNIEEEDENVTPEALKKGRKLVRQNMVQRTEDSEEENEGDDEDARIKEQIRIYEEKIRRKELNLKKRRKDMERNGFRDIIEGEAEESDDEWKGIGGADGELDDDRANSEDERMIDNNFNIDLNDDEVKKKFMEQYQIKDQKELEKLIDDIKNHKLAKRFKNHNGFDIELSDEEDELLIAYRRQKLQEQRLRLLESAKLQKLTKSDKAKAFFNSIEEETVKILIDEEKSEEESEELEENEAPEDEDKENKPSERPKKIKIQQAFIQKQLSFLSNPVNEYEIAEHISNRQHDLDYDSDDEIDLKSLKMQSLNNLRSMTSKRTITEIETDNDDNNDDETQEIASEDELMPSRKPSIIKSFRSTPSDSSLSFSGVTISKQYKVASGSKASITYMSRAATSNTKSLKRIKHQKSINRLQHQNNMKKLFNSNNFN